MAAGRMLDVLGALACGIALALAMRSASYELTYGVYIDGLVAEAQRAEIGEPVLDLLRALKYEAPQPKDDAEDDAVELSRAQPEYAWSPWEYLARVVTAERIRLGRVQLARYPSLFKKLEERYGVPREIVVAIWAVETNFGRYQGRFPVLRTLAVLGFYGNRREFGRREILAALQILQAGDIAPDAMRGSWAGAMGHTQFIPSSYMAYAVDYDGDARRDIWHNVADALASTANYLQRAGGWRRGERWGHAVYLTPAFDYRTLLEGGSKSLTAWAQLGVRGAPRGDSLARLVLPGGAHGPAFLVMENFSALLSYNNAPLYALAVGHLADRLAGGKPLAVAWPLGERPLNRTETRELQLLMHAAGFSAVHMDGLLGPLTRRAIAAYQRAEGLTPDSWPTPSLLSHARRAAAAADADADAGAHIDAAHDTPMMAQRNAMAGARPLVFGELIAARPRRSDELIEILQEDALRKERRIVPRPTRLIADAEGAAPASKSAPQ